MRRYAQFVEFDGAIAVIGKQCPRLEFSVMGCKVLRRGTGQKQRFAGSSSSMINDPQDTSSAVAIFAKHVERRAAFAGFDLASIARLTPDTFASRSSE